jgi:hypothetical protein
LNPELTLEVSKTPVALEIVDGGSRGSLEIEFL